MLIPGIGRRINNGATSASSRRARNPCCFSSGSAAPTRLGMPRLGCCLLVGAHRAHYVLVAVVSRARSMSAESMGNGAKLRARSLADLDRTREGQVGLNGSGSSTAHEIRSDGWPSSDVHPYFEPLPIASNFGPPVPPDR
jgi:hypothetical protein